MNLRQLQTLITIADAGGFAGAAGRLNLSQPAASRQIQALEAELGVLLFDRIGRRLQLTSEGRTSCVAGAVCCRKRIHCATAPTRSRAGSRGRCG